MRARRSSVGLSLLELIVAVSMTGLMIAVTFLLLKNSTATWQKTTSSQDAASQLLKAESWLRRDLLQAAYEACASGPSVTSLVGRDGDAIWFLSAIDPVTGEFIRNDDGTPRWQRNILYYSVIPSGLPTSKFSGSGIDEAGYEVSHPAKLLIRKVIDEGTPTIAADASTEESLITDISSYLEVPSGTFVNGPNAESSTIIGRDLLQFRVTRDDAIQRIRIVLQAAKLKDRQLEFAIGSESLLKPGYLLERRLEIYPENRDI